MLCISIFFQDYTEQTFLSRLLQAILFPSLRKKNAQTNLMRKCHLLVTQILLLSSQLAANNYIWPQKGKKYVKPRSLNNKH